MPVQALVPSDSKRFFNLTPASGTEPQRFNAGVSAIAVSNDLSGRPSVTTAKGDIITLTADLESDFRTANAKSSYDADGAAVKSRRNMPSTSSSRSSG